MIFQRHDVRYGLDKVEFITKKSLDDVMKTIATVRPIKVTVGTIKTEAIKNGKKIKPSYKDAYRDGFRTIVRLTNITPELFGLLKGTEIILGKPLLVEIFQDIVCDSEKEAIALTEKHIQYSHMLYQEADWHIYDRNKIRSQRKTPPPKNATTKEYESYLYSISYRQMQREINKEIIGNRTLYLSDKKKSDKKGSSKKGNMKYAVSARQLNVHQSDEEPKFTYTAYARLSKKDKKAVMHHEFRVKGWHLSKKLGVRKKGTSYLDTLKNLTGLHSAKVFDNIYGNSIRLSKINEDKLSKHHLGWSDKKNFTKSDEDKIKTYGKQLKRIWKLDTTASYMHYFKENDLDYRLFIEALS